jgi:D-beta-D-heptose 7-phosphate kinase/D-beta-D-heptose 1-phosphate adenosyltransferase
MKTPRSTLKRIGDLINVAGTTRILVIGDVMLDQFIWGRVARISPEAPVPVVEFERENFMPGGAANVARNLRTLGAHTDLLAVVGEDSAADNLRDLLEAQEINCDGLLREPSRMTSIKTRIIAHQQQVVRIDRETRAEIDKRIIQKLIAVADEKLAATDAVIIGDYGKGVVTQELILHVREQCRQRGLWVSLDPKPVHHLSLAGLSLITPNRKEAFELAGLHDNTRAENPLKDGQLLRAADMLLENLQPALLLITLGDQGMLLCKRSEKPRHFPTVAQEVFDVSGAGDTVIASFTLAIAAGASPEEAAIFSNHAAGVVVGKVGTATVTPDELLASFQREQ